MDSSQTAKVVTVSQDTAIINESAQSQQNTGLTPIDNATSLTINPKAEEGNLGAKAYLLYNDNMEKAGQQIQILKQKNSLQGETLEKEIKDVNKNKNNKD